MVETCLLDNLTFKDKEEMALSIRHLLISFGKLPLCSLAFILGDIIGGMLAALLGTGSAHAVQTVKESPLGV